MKRNLAVPGVVGLGEAAVEADPAKTQGEPVALLCDVDTFLLRPELREEVFGPHTLLVLARTVAELEAAARSLAGSLTATFHATPEERGTRLWEKNVCAPAPSGVHSLTLSPATFRIPLRGENNRSNIAVSFGSGAACFDWARKMNTKPSPRQVLPMASTTCATRVLPHAPPAFSA